MGLFKKSPKQPKSPKPAMSPAEEWAKQQNQNWKDPEPGTTPKGPGYHDGHPETASQERDRKEGLRILLQGGPFNGKAVATKPGLYQYWTEKRGYAPESWREVSEPHSESRQVVLGDYNWRETGPDGVHIYQYNPNVVEDWK
jgi:hypothetical protein